MPTPETTAAAPFTRVSTHDLTGTTRLYHDFLHRPDEVAEFFGPRFDLETDLRGLADRISARTYPRGQMAAVLRELADDYGAGAAARAHIAKLEQAESLVVFAGQQVGLFTGPLYTIYKALATERWAAQLSERLQRPVVPCFWLSTYDHDFAEVDHVHVPVGRELRRLPFAPCPVPDGDPVGRIKIDGAIADVLAALAEALPETEFKADVIETLSRCYAPGTRFASAFGRLWFELFPDSGLVPVSPCHRGFKELARPFLLAAITDEQALYTAYATASARLADRGYHQQVHKVEGQTFLFYQQFKRHSIHREENGGYVWEGAEPVTRSWLEQRIAERPDYFSPNVLLRPVVQNGLFPTLGVTLGPSETAYYAQIGGVHDHFDVPRPAILPRTSITLVEKSVAKRVEKNRIRLPGLCKDPDAEVARVLHASFPTDLETQFDNALKQIAEAFEGIRPDLVGFEPTLDKPVRAAAARAQRELSGVAQKAYAAHKRKQEETEAQIRRVALQLFPRGGLQERTFNIVYYWARYGPDFPARLYEALPAGTREHLMWEL